MNVFLEPTGLHSRSMLRTARALERYAPSGIQIVQRQEDADLVILHVIGADAIGRANDVLASGKRYAAIQYCLKTAGLPSTDYWLLFWKMAEVTMSYYDLRELSKSEGFNFYFAPLGLDDTFRRPVFDSISRENRIITSGYVSGPGAEAIEEVWIASERVGMKVTHVGPDEVGGITRKPDNCQTVSSFSDDGLADLYRRSTFVSGLRHVEGFEMPAIEGLAGGARPILFDQPSQRYWYRENGIYVQDRSGEELIEDLVRILESPPEPISNRERVSVLARFDWSWICTGFWWQVNLAMENAA